MQDPCLGSFRQLKHVGNTEHIGLNGSDRVELIEDRRRWTSEIVNLIHLKIDRVDNVVTDDFKPRPIEKWVYVLF